MYSIYIYNLIYVQQYLKQKIGQHFYTYQKKLLLKFFRKEVSLG